MDISMDNWVDQIGLEKWIWKSFVHQLSLGYISIYIQDPYKNIHILLIFLYRNYPPYRWGQQPFLLIGLSKNREEVSCVTRPVAKITRVVASRLEPTRILSANRVAPRSDTMMLMTFLSDPLTIGITLHGNSEWSGTAAARSGGAKREEPPLLDPPRSYARWGRSVLRTADATTNEERRNGESIPIWPPRREWSRSSSSANALTLLSPRCSQHSEPRGSRAKEIGRGKERRGKERERQRAEAGREREREGQAGE